MGLPSYEELIATKPPSAPSYEELVGQQSLADRAKNDKTGNSRFYPDPTAAQQIEQETAQSLPAQIAFGTYKAANTALFGAPKVISNVAMAATDTAQGEGLGNNLIERFRKNYKAAVDDQAEVQEKIVGDSTRGKVIEALGEGVGFLLNPVTRLVGAQFAGAKVTAKATTQIAKIGLAATRGAAEFGGVSAAEMPGRILDRYLAGEDDIKGVAVDEAYNTLKQTGIGAAGAGLLTTATAPFKSVISALGVPVRAVSSAIRSMSKLSPEQELLFQNAAKAATTNKAEQAKILADSQKQIGKMFADTVGNIKDKLANDAAAQNPLVEDMLLQTKQAVENETTSVVQNLINKSTSGLRENLKNLSGIVGGLGKRASDNYGRGLDAIAKDHPNIRVDIADDVNTFFNNLASSEESAIMLDKNGKFLQFSDQAKKSYPDVIKFFEEVGSNTNLSFSQAVRFKQMLGAVVNWGKQNELKPSEQAMRELWDGVANKLGDEKILGSAAAEEYRILRQGYTTVMENTKELAKISKSLGQHSQFNDSADFLSRMQGSLRSLGSATRVKDVFNAGAKPLAAFSAEEEKLLSQTFTQAKNALDVNKITKSREGLRKSLRDFVNGELKDTDEVLKKFDVYKEAQSITDKAGEHTGLTVVRDAIKDPRKIPKALEFMEAYGKYAKPALKDLLDRAAKLNRISGVSDPVKYLRSLKDPAAKEAADMLDMIIMAEPKMEKLLKNVDFAEAFMKHEINAFSTAIGAGQAVYGASKVATGNPWGAVSVMLGMAKLNATSIRIFAEKMQNRPAWLLNDKTIMDIAQASGRITKLIAQQAVK